TTRRSCDTVVIAGGRTGTLGELAIAYDEGRLIGVLTGTGGITAIVEEILRVSGKETGACVIYDDDPVKLVDRLIHYYHTQHFRRPSCFCDARAGGGRLLVDGGLYQGLKELRLRNWDRLPVDPASIDWVVLTHAHIDHTGYLPRLLKDGFKGRVCATRRKAALLRVLLPDSGPLQEEEAAYHNKRGTSKHKPALPLYTAEEGLKAAKRVAGIAYRG